MGWSRSGHSVSSGSVDRCVSLYVGGLSRALLWIYLLLCLFSTGTMAELCIYKRSVYNIFTSSYDKMLTTTSCPWGCCYKHNSPCCPAPISLIVGCVLGGVLLVALVIIAICCCCVCRRRAPGRGGDTAVTSVATSRVGSRQTRGGRDPEADQQSGPVVFHSDASQTVDFPAHRVYDPPPSYDEVMRGESNPAFKPDSE